jgi:arsenical-resistance protein 2
MQDYIDGKGDKDMKSVALEGGIKGWVDEGGKLLKLMDGYNADAWSKH